METVSHRPDATPSSAESSSVSSANQVTTSEAGVPIAPADELPAPLQDHTRYRILKKLGEGGMGAVYLAEHKLMHRLVALKLIRAELATQPQLLQRFHREVRAVARLTHPHIVHAYDAEQAGNCHFLVMEYVEGIDLARLLQEHGPLPVHEACASIRQAALGLAHAQEHQLIHRDLKPQNLMRSTDGTIKILDFGLARALQQTRDEGEGGTASGMILGTPDYMAPEQADDAGTVDIRADIYSLGCTLYHLLAGQVPFPGPSLLSKLHKHASEQPTPLNGIRPDIPSALMQIVSRMMAKEPATRYQTPAEVADALQPWSQRPVETMEAPRSPGTMTETREYRWPFVRRLLWPYGLLALALLLILGVLALYFRPAWLQSGKDIQEKDNAADSLATSRPNRVTPTDLSQVQPVIDDDFGGVAKLPFFPPGQEADRFLQKWREEIKLRDHRLILTLSRKTPPRFTSCSPLVYCADFVCEARCRIQGKGDVGWAISHKDDGDTMLWVMVRLDGVVEVNESGKTAATAFRNRLGTFPLPSTSHVEDFTTLRVERRGQILKLFVNGEVLGEPFRLERNYDAGHQCLAVWDRGTGEAKAEFTHYTLWRLP